MQWGLTDRFVDEVIQVYRSRAQAERALARVLADEPEWEGMIEIVPLSPADHCRWFRKARPVQLASCRQI
jgi:hypothetical protein